MPSFLEGSFLGAFFLLSDLATLEAGFFSGLSAVSFSVSMFLSPDNKIYYGTLRRGEQRKAPAEVPMPRLMMKHVHTEQPARRAAERGKDEQRLFAHAPPVRDGKALINTHKAEEHRAHYEHGGKAYIVFHIHTRRLSVKRAEVPAGHAVVLDEVSVRGILYYAHLIAGAQGQNVIGAVVAVGNMVEEVVKAQVDLDKEGITFTFVNARFIKPLDVEQIKKLAQTHDVIITVEEHIYQGGYGQMVAAYCMEEELPCKVHSLAIRDCFVEHGSVDVLRTQLGLDADSIKKEIKKYFMTE